MYAIPPPRLPSLVENKKLKFGWEASVRLNHLLTTKPTSALPPPGRFIREDMYACERWHRVQYLVEQFCGQLSREYLYNMATSQVGILHGETSKSATS